MSGIDARRDQIKERISDLQYEIKGQNYLKDEFTHSKQKIETAITSWKQARDKYNNIAMAEVEVTSYFEGSAAKRTKEKVTNTMQEIEKLCTYQESLLAGVTDQIKVIGDYIFRMESEILSLQQELVSLAE